MDKIFKYDVGDQVYVLPLKMQGVVVGVSPSGAKYYVRHPLMWTAPDDFYGRPRPRKANTRDVKMTEQEYMAYELLPFTEGVKLLYD